MCNCGRAQQLQTDYNHIKSVAQKYSNEIGEVVIVYKTSQGYFQFVEAGVPESNGIYAIEYLCPVQGTAP